MSVSRNVFLFLTMLGILVASNPGQRAQGQEFGPSGGFGDLGGFGAAASGPKLEYSATFKITPDGTSGTITLTADVAIGQHTYTINQPPGGPTPTTIEVNDSNIELTGPFTPDVTPHITSDPSWPDVRVEEFDGVVNWTAPFKAKQSLTEESTIAIVVDGLVCGGGSCVPVDDKLDAAFSEHLEAIGDVTKLRGAETHAEWSVSLDHSAAAPGDTITLQITANVDSGYHIYEFVPNDKAEIYRTLITATNKSGLRFGTPQTDTALETIEDLDEPVKYYDGSVTWQVPVSVPENASPGEHSLELEIGYFTCNDRGCDPPSALRAAAKLLISDKAKKEELAFGLNSIPMTQVQESPLLGAWIDEDSQGGEVQKAYTPLTLLHLLAALGGGFILNFMPCVLPVIGLKVLSFVNQAGNNHGRVVALNLSFVAGIISVLMALASLTVIATLLGNSFAWGEQFTSTTFKVVLAGLIFAMALSFLGVWEIPIPGFASSSTSNDLMEKEGLVGAFLKGILTTVLATPCSGPMLGALFALTVTLSPLNVLLLYFVMGLGMSLPYLVLCFFPGLVDKLPRPGAWMETLKQILAFPLLLTVVFFVSSLSDDYRIATFLTLIFIWFACWLLGRVPAYANADRKLTAWASAVVTIALGVVVSFNYFGPIEHKLPWVKYNEPQLAQYRKEGKAVLVEFTANWCLNCQVNMRMAIDRDKVAEVVEKNGVVTMVADWTDKDDEIRNKLTELGSNSIPLLVIYPAGLDSEPIILPDLLTESQVVEALEQAGPSQDVEQSRLTSAPVH